MNPNSQLAFKEPSRGGVTTASATICSPPAPRRCCARRRPSTTRSCALLLAHGALVDLPNASGVTPFMAAAGIGTRNGSGVLGAGPPDNVDALSLETMEILRKAGADVNARITDVTSLTARIARTNTMTGRQGQTALFLAADTGRTEVVRYLIDHGARTDLMDDAGKTALDLVQGRGEGGRADDARTKEIVTLLRGTGSALKN